MQLEPSATRVVLAEDGVLLRQGLAGLLERFGFCVAAVTGDAEGLMAAVAEHAPDLAITDIRMPPTFTLSSLSAREREVLALIAEGLSNAAIARKLFVTEAAVGKRARQALREDHEGASVLAVGR